MTTNSRIIAIDVLRGITLLGVVIVNAVTINGPYYLDSIDFAYSSHWLDKYTADILSAIFLEKFYPIFVFLFGLSNQLFLTSLNKKYSDITTLKIFSKRMLVLSLIGIIHLSFFFWGDVLLVYSLLGLLYGLLLNTVLKNNISRILKLNLFLILFSIFLNYCLSYNLNLDLKHSNFDDHYVFLNNKFNLQHIELAYQNGGALHILYHNLYSFYKLYIYAIFNNIDILILLDNINYLTEMFILMLFGAAIAITPNWDARLLNTKPAIILSLILLSSLVNIAPDYLNYFNILFVINNIILYISIFLICYKLCSKYNQAELILNKIASIGRMTLTWYLLLSTSMSFILYNYGLSLYGKITITYCCLIAILYYYFCYKVSFRYLKKFKQGPIEKLWRKLSLPPASNVLIEIK